jgi:hypothetical protein
VSGVGYFRGNEEINGTKRKLNDIGIRIYEVHVRTLIIEYMYLPISISL